MSAEREISCPPTWRSRWPLTIAPDTSEYAEITNAIWASVDDPEAQSIPVLFERLAERFGDELPDPGALWSLLLTLHAEGIIEVSQMVEGHTAERGPVTGIRITGAAVPTDLVARITARQGLLLEEIEQVVDFFSSTGKCVNQRFAEYFNVDTLPELCSQPDVRCTYHWDTVEGSADSEPDLLGAFLRPAIAFTSNVEFRRRELRDLPGLIEELLLYQRRGLAVNLIGPVLRGQSHYQAKGGTRKPLWPALIENRFFNTMPTLKRDELDAAMGALAAKGKIVAEGALWWHPATLAAIATDEARRQQRRDQAVAREAARNARDEASMAQATLGFVP